MITKLSVKAFKGLRSFDISPKKMNLLIGANGTGKTNFADLIAFISGLGRRGLSETIADFGGLTQVRTRSSRGTPYTFQVKLQLGEDRSRHIQKVEYSFELAQSNDIRVQSESLDAIVYERPTIKAIKEGKARSPEELEPIEIRYRREGEIITEWSSSSGQQGLDFVAEDELVLSSLLRGIRVVSNYIASWRVYNIDPGIAKQSLSTDEQELRKDGSNIVPFVARLLRDPKNQQQLLQDLQEAIPYIQQIRPDSLLSLTTLRFTERDINTEFQLPDISDGTIRLLGLLAIVNQELPPAVMVIEEPENTLHAYAIHQFLSRARQTAMRTENASQMFFTSHSPVVVDEILNLDVMQETGEQSACFVTQRKPDSPSIIPAPHQVMQAIAENLGRPSDFQREGNFGDEPINPTQVVEQDSE